MISARDAASRCEGSADARNADLGIDPYTYLIDVLQRVAEHPARRVTELTPRPWKQYFAATPLRSDLEQFSTR